MSTTPKPKFSGLKKSRPTPDSSTVSIKEVEAATKADDEPPVVIQAPSMAEAEKVFRTRSTKKKDFLVPLPIATHEALQAAAVKLTEDSIGTVSMRQLATKLIIEGLARLNEKS